MKSFNKALCILVVLALSACGRRHGLDGVQGSSGQNGTNGFTSLVSVVNAAPTCYAGGITVASGVDLDRSGTLDANEVTSAQVVCNGVAGVDGASGTNGISGHNSLISIVHAAPDCAAGGITLLAGIDADDSGSLTASEVSSSGEVCNGSNGLPGADAPPTAFTPVGLINPCGDAPGIFDEVFLKLQNGTVLASFSDNTAGQNTRFSVLVAGSYMTTDGDNCTFNLSSTGVISGENHHY